jgi:hypothetical protein
MPRIWIGVRNNGLSKSAHARKRWVSPIFGHISLASFASFASFLHVCIIKNLHFERELTNPHLIEQILGESTDAIRRALPKYNITND